MAAAWDGIGILGVGVSGQGKSTLARLLHDAGAAVLTDERPIVRQVCPHAGQPSAVVSPAAFRVYGSPWPSSGGFFRNAHAPLRHIYLLEHGSTDRIVPLPPREALRRLIPVIAIPWQDPVLLDACLQTLDALLSAVPCSVFAFRPESGAARCLRDHLGAPVEGVLT
jgi:hypothetical protein